VAGASRDLVVRLLGDTSKFSQSLKGASNDVSRFGGSLTRTLTPIAAGVAAGMTAIGTSFNEARNNIVSGTGATGQALKDLMNDTRAVGAQVPISFGEAGTAVANLNTRLGLTGKELQVAAIQVARFATIFGLDIDSATNDVGKLMNALGIGPEGLNGLLDKLAFASQASGIQVSRLMGFIVEAGPAFEELGFGLDESIALFAQFEAAGARPEELIGSLNIVMTKMAREGITDAREGFANLVQRIKDAPDILSATGIAADAFGARVGGKVAEDIRAGRFEIDDFVESLQGSSGIVDQSAEDMLTLSGRLAMLRNRLVGVLGPFGELGGAAAGVLASVGPLIFGLGQMLPAIAKVRVAMIGLATVMRAHPVLTAAAVIGGLALAFSDSKQEIDGATTGVMGFGDATENIRPIVAVFQELSKIRFSNLSDLGNIGWKDAADGLINLQQKFDPGAKAAGALGNAFGRLLGKTEEVTEATGESADYQEMLARVTADTERAKSYLETQTEDLTSALEDEQKALQDATRAATEKRNAVDAMADAQRASTDSVFAHRRAQQTFREQLETTNKAINDQSLSADEQQIALDDLAISAGRVADAAVEVAKKQAEARGETLSGAAATKTFNQSMIEQAAQASGPTRQAIIDYIAEVNNIPATKASEIQALIDEGKLDEAAAKLNAASETRSAQIKAEADEAAAIRSENRLELISTGRQAEYLATVPSSLRDAAERELNETARPRDAVIRIRTQMQNTGHSHLISLANRHVGGRVSSGQAVQPLSGETFVPDSPGRIMSREDTMRMIESQQQGRGGVTMNVTVNNPRSEDDVRRALSRALALAELQS
jgi:TP901 family phage tail tape measure protein